jgi:hypothetical protein
MSFLVTFASGQTGVKPSYLTQEQGWFSQITCSTAGTVSVKGTSILEFIASGASITGHIDPATGTTGVGTASSSGYFEALPGTQVSIPMAAGDTINGHFTHISTDSNFKGWGYANKLDGDSPHIY